MLDKLRIAQYRFTMTAQEEIHLPQFQGKVWRGAFGAVFRRTICAQPHRKECTDCLMRERCAYAYLFATPVPTNAKVLRHQESAPRPFVLEPGSSIPTPLQEARHFTTGNRLSLGLTLIGQAIEYLPYFIVVFQELGKTGIGRERGNYKLETVHAVCHWTGDKTLIYQNGVIHADVAALELTYADITTRARSIWEYNEGDVQKPCEAIKVSFLTPTRLKHQGHYVCEPEFHVLVRGLLRRISMLYYFHCGERWEVNFHEWLDRAAQVQVTAAKTRWWKRERYSRRQEQRVKLSGFVGQMAYTGALAKFLPLLLIGELVHIGKGTVFGNGRLRIEPDGAADAAAEG